MSSPLIRVYALNGTNVAPAGSPSPDPRSRASATIERPSGVSSASDERYAIRARSLGSTPWAAIISTA